MKIIFGNKKELVCKEAYISEENYDGAIRKVATLVFSTSVISLNDLNKLSSTESNISTFTIVNDDLPDNPITTIYDDFAIKMEVSQYRVPGADESAEEVVRLKLGKYTTIEKKLKELGVL